MRYHPDKDTEWQLDRILNNGIEFADQMKGVMIQHDFKEGDNEVTHGLGYVPTGFILILKSGPGEIYGTRDTEWTGEKMFLRCDATNLRARLFVL